MFDVQKTFYSAVQYSLIRNILFLNLMQEIEVSVQTLYILKQCLDIYQYIFYVTTQVDRLKTEDCQEKAHFEAMFGAKKRYFR